VRPESRNRVNRLCPFDHFAHFIKVRSANLMKLFLKPSMRNYFALSPTHRLPMLDRASRRLCGESPQTGLPPPAPERNPPPGLPCLRPPPHLP
jgi:hypothetical protein